MKTILIAAALAVAAPALAQPAPPAPPEAPRGPGGHGWRGHGLPGLGMLGRAWRDLSPQGRETMRAALTSLKDDGTRERIRAARSRMVDLLGAERLDVAALERAMLEERNLAQGQHARAQVALLGALQRLSAEDRRVLAAGAREARERMDARRERWREFRRQRERQQGAAVDPERLAADARRIGEEARRTALASVAAVDWARVAEDARRAAEEALDAAEAEPGLI